MNLKEREMLEVLKRGKLEFGVVSIKAEFEAEGTRVDELLRLVELARKADLKLTLKIGGCECIRDIIECKQIGIDYLVAPMVETPYALSKFIDAKNKVYTQEEQKDIKFYINLETITGYENLSLMIEKAKNNLDGLVFGRHDFVNSIGQDGFKDIDTPPITKYGCEIATACKESNLEFIVGGGMCVESIEPVREIRSVHLTRYETRKVVFNEDAITFSNVEEALLNALNFELLWLKNKCDYYNSISQEDKARINKLESRWSEELSRWVTKNGTR